MPFHCEWESVSFWNALLFDAIKAWNFNLLDTIMFYIPHLISHLKCVCVSACAFRLTWSYLPHKTLDRKTAFHPFVDVFLRISFRIRISKFDTVCIDVVIALNTEGRESGKNGSCNPESIHGLMAYFFFFLPIVCSKRSHKQQLMLVLSLSH